MSRRKYYIEVSTLLDPAWSGIAHVTAQFCRSMLRLGVDVEFFAFDRIIDRAMLEHALRISDGVGLRLLLDHDLAMGGFLAARRRDGVSEIAIYPNFRRAGQDFDTEVLIVHDISFVLTPEFHEPDRTRDYMAKLMGDMHAVDRVVCVSGATARDVIRYFGVVPARVSVSHLGVEQPASEAAIDPSRPSQADLQGLRELDLQPGRYFLVLGTIEPRKNVGLVLDYIQAHPGILDAYKVVFAGRDGWGPTLAAQRAARHLDDPRVVHLGYVPDALRQTLLRHAAALLFPSWFEGFGLPVLEAMAVGTPVVGSRSSSIVEAGGDVMCAFDPGSLEDFTATLESLMSLPPDRRARLAAAGVTHAAQFTWDGFRDRVLDAAAEVSPPDEPPPHAAARPDLAPLAEPEPAMGLPIQEASPPEPMTAD